VAAKNPAQGWAVLRVCADKYSWSDVDKLLSPPWASLVKSRPDAHLLMARVISLQGGDIQYTMRMFSRGQLPLVSLAEALDNPDGATGKVILFRGRVKFLDTMDGKRGAMLGETTVRQNDKMVQWLQSQGSTARAPQVYWLSGYESMFGWDPRVRRFTPTTVVGTGERKVTESTGRHAFVRLGKAVPDLQRDKEYICVMRLAEVVDVSTEEQRTGDENSVAWGPGLRCEHVATKLLGF
jgi:hypothetical protein